MPIDNVQSGDPLYVMLFTHLYTSVSVESSLHLSPTHSQSHMITSISESEAPLNNKMTTQMLDTGKSKILRIRVNAPKKTSQVKNMFAF